MLRTPLSLVIFKAYSKLLLMKTIIVPTDFSETAKNAAEYAFKIASTLHFEKIIFYNAYQVAPIITEATMPAMPAIDIETLNKISNEGMKLFLKSIEHFNPGSIIIEEKTAFDNVSDGIKLLCDEGNGDLVIMGISASSKVEEVLIGSTATSAMKHLKKPLIIVPGGAKFTLLRNIMFACDYENVAETIPLEPIKEMVKDTSATLHVVNVYKDEQNISADKIYQQELLAGLLNDLNPQFHYINNADFIDGINHFVNDHQVDMIITIPKKHGFFDGLFRERHTKQLAFHSHVPLFCIHDEEL